MSYEENDAHDDDDFPADRPPPAEPDAAIMGAIEAEHGDRVMVLEASLLDTVVVVRKAGPDDIRAFKLRVVSNDREKQASAHAQLFWGCLLWPKREAMLELAKFVPLAPDQFGKTILESAGDTMKVRQKKPKRV